MFINVGFITSMLEKQNTGLNEVIDMPSKYSQLHDLVRSQVGRHLENELAICQRFYQLRIFNEWYDTRPSTFTLSGDFDMFCYTSNNLEPVSRQKTAL